MRGSLLLRPSAWPRCARRSERRPDRRVRLGDEPEARARPKRKFLHRQANKNRSFNRRGIPAFVHTPSLTQASTVAILRSGHLAHSPAMKCRTICWRLICRRSVCGWRHGCSMACDKDNRSARCWVTASSAGCRKSASLSSSRVFRELAPLVARKLEPDQPEPNPVEAIAANNVVDGLALLRRWQKGKKRHTAAMDQRHDSVWCTQSIRGRSSFLHSISTTLISKRFEMSWSSLEERRRFRQRCTAGRERSSGGARKSVARREHSRIDCRW